MKCGVVVGSEAERCWSDGWLWSRMGMHGGWAAEGGGGKRQRGGAYDSYSWLHGARVFVHRGLTQQSAVYNDIYTAD